VGGASLPEIVGAFEVLLYGVAPFLWSLGLRAVPIPFGTAVQTMHDNTVASATGSPTDVVFSSQEAISTWTILTGDPTSIVNAVSTNAGDVGAAVVHIPAAVIDDVVDARRDTVNAATGTDLAGVAAADLGTEVNLGALLGGPDPANLLPAAVIESLVASL